MTKNYEQILTQNETLHTPRLTLRKFTKADVQDVFEYASDPEVPKYMTWDAHKTLKESEEVIDWHMNTQGMWAIEFESKLVGSIGISLKPEHEKASFGYALNRKFWGKGFMTEALSAVLRLCFEKLELNRVEATHFTENPASGKVMQKCGMKIEGMTTRNRKFKGIFHDEVHYAILKEDFI